MNKQSKIQAGLGFGACMAIIYIIFDLVGTEELTTGSVLISILSGIIGGAVAGLLFPWLAGILLNMNYIKRSIEIKTLADENIVFHTSANHIMGMEGVGGKLYLTNKRLVFKSHNLNIQKHELSIPLEEILQVNRYKSLGIINKGLIVTLSSGKEEKFIVEEASKWMEYLKQSKPAIADI